MKKLFKRLLILSLSVAMTVSLSPKTVSAQLSSNVVVSSVSTTTDSSQNYNYAPDGKLATIQVNSRNMDFDRTSDIYEVYGDMKLTEMSKDSPEWFAYANKEVTKICSFVYKHNIPANSTINVNGGGTYIQKNRAILQDGSLADVKYEYSNIVLVNKNDFPITQVSFIRGHYFDGAAITADRTNLANIAVSVDIKISVVKDGQIIDGTMWFGSNDLDVIGTDEQYGPNNYSESFEMIDADMLSSYIVPANHTMQSENRSGKTILYGSQATNGNNEEARSGFMVLIKNGTTTTWRGRGMGMGSQFNFVTKTMSSSTSKGGTIETSDNGTNYKSDETTGKLNLQSPLGKSLTYTMKAKDGYVLGKVVVDGQEITPSKVNDNTYTYAFNNITANHEISVNWNPVKYPINYVLNGGENNPANPSSYTVEDEVNILEPSRDGYDFLGWEEGDKIPVGSTGEKTFTANWELSTQKGIINFLDEEGNVINPAINFEGKSFEDFPQDNPVAIQEIIDKLLKEGYELVSNDYPEDGKFDSDKDTDQIYNVILRPRIVEVTHKEPKNPGDIIDDITDVKYPDGVKLSDLQRTIIRTIEHRLKTKDGEKVFKDEVQNVVFTRKATFNLVTKELVYSDWTSEDNLYKKYDAPAKEGHHTDKDNVAEQEVAVNDQNTIETIIYMPNIYKVTFVDGLDNKTIDKQDVEYMASAKDPGHPSHDGYYFAGWDKKFDKITGDLIVTARYEKNPVVAVAKKMVSTGAGTSVVVASFSMAVAGMLLILNKKRKH